MTEKQKRFCDEYLIDLNGTRAYKAAYPNVKSDKAAGAASARLLGNVSIRAYLDERLEQLHSAKTADAVEVMDEFAGIEEIRTINQSLLRGGSKFTVFYTYNPPKSQRNWINAAVTVPAVDKLVHHSDYRGVPPEWLGEQFIAEAEYLRRNNPTAYAHEYLGEVTGTGGEVFPNITVREISPEERAGFAHIHRGLDWGYAADPTAYVVCALEKGRLYIFSEIYRYGIKYDPLAEAIKAENPLNGTIYAESADPRSNDELRARGLKITAVKKGAGSVEHGITWLQNLAEIVIDPVTCPNAKREFCGYELIPDGNGGFRDEFPDKDNHSIDAVRYALENDIGRRKARIGNVPCMSDESFGGNASGVAMRYKLLGFEQITKIKERYFREGLKERLRLLCNWLSTTGKAAISSRDISIQFTRALPVNETEVAQLVSELRDMVPREILLGLLPFVDDPESAAEKVRAQQNDFPNLPPDMTDEQP